MTSSSQRMHLDNSGVASLAVSFLSSSPSHHSQQKIIRPSLTSRTSPPYLSAMDSSLETTSNGQTAASTVFLHLPPELET